MMADGDGIPCGVACLYAALHLSGQPYPLDTLLRRLRPSAYGLWLTDLAQVCLTLGADPHVWSHSVTVFQADWVGLDPIALCRTLEENLVSNNSILIEARRSALIYLAGGGKLYLRPPEAAHLVDVLPANHIAIAAVASSCLDPGLDGGHFVIIHEHASNTAVILNPQTDHLAVETLPLGRLETAWCSWGGWLLTIPIRK